MCNNTIIQPKLFIHNKKNALANANAFYGGPTGIRTPDQPVMSRWL